MPFKRIGNESREGRRENSYNHGFTGKGRETRAELERTTGSEWY
jgi:hypothetical protein